MATNALMKVIVGSTQSKYAAWAIALTILVLCISVLVMQTDVPIGKRLLGVLFMILITVPGVVLSLIELTCLVTGGSWKTNWWCWLLAWVIAIIVIVWCFVIIGTTFNSIFTYSSASKKIKDSSISATEEEANDFAENILYNSESLSNQESGLQENIVSELEELDQEFPEDEVDLDNEVFENSLENSGDTLEGFSNCGQRKKEKFSNCGSTHKNGVKEHLSNHIAHNLEHFKNRRLRRNN